jgi:hypothetical protein
MNAPHPINEERLMDPFSFHTATAPVFRMSEVVGHAGRASSAN